MDVQEFLHRLKNVKQRGENQYIASCPTREDKHQSLSVSVGKDGRILLYDHGGADVVQILDAMGLTMRDLFVGNECTTDRNIVAVYCYVNEAGQVVAEKVRYAPKCFVWRAPLPDGKFDNHKPGFVPPYNVLALKMTQVVFLVEGEKDVNTLTQHGLTATCLPDGAMSGKWPDKYTEYFAGKYVIIIPDNDDVGRAYAKSAQKALDGVAVKCRMLDLQDVWPELPQKGDVSDYIATKGEEAVDMLKQYREDAENVMTATTATVTPSISSVPTKVVMNLDESVSTVLKTKEDFYDELVEIDPCNDKNYEMTDIGSGRLFADIVKGQARYVAGQKVWYVYDGIRWVRDEENLKVVEMCKTVGDALYMYAKSIKDDEKRGKYKSYAFLWQRHLYRKTILTEAASVYSITMKVFDTNPYLLNCQNGTLNLQTMQFKQHNPDDFLTKVTDAAYNPNASFARFKSYLSEVMSGDTAKSVFLQKALGYALSGDNSRECLFIFYGATARNGKSTLTAIVYRILGNYALTVDAETFAVKKRNTSAPSEDVARLAGCRLANISEPPRDLRLNAAMIKNMTGEDYITARKLYANSFEFQPQCKIYINTNYLPHLDDRTAFDSDRIWVIPFDRHFTLEERDITLKSSFNTDEAKSAILNWLIEGWILLQKEGMNPPQAVWDATQEYCGESDEIGQFAEDELVAEDTAEVRTAQVYERYKAWCSANGYRPMNNRNFKKAVARLGTIESKRPHDGGEKTTILLGYRLKEVGNA